MSDISQTPFYRQFNRKFIATFIVALLLFVSLYTLVYQSHVRLKSLSSNQLPSIEKYIKIKQLSFENDLLYNAISTAKTATDIEINERVLSKNLQTLLTLITPRSEILQQIIAEQENIESDISRFSRNSTRNIQLKQSSIIQLQLVLDSLEQIISGQEEKQKSLLNQITDDRVNDRVTATRARAHAVLMKELNEYRQSQQLFASVMAVFQALNVQTSLVDFDIANEAVTRGFDLLTSVLENRNNDLNEFREQVTTLEQLLFTEHRTLAKWRGHLRLAQEYLSLIAQQQGSLKALPKIDEVEVNTESSMVNTLNQWINNESIQLTDQHIKYTLLTTAFLLLFILCILLFRIRVRIKRYGEQSIKMCRQALDAKADNPPEIFSAENQVIANLISDIQLPLHSESDYQALVKQHRQQLSIFTEHAKICYWHISSNEDLLNVDDCKKVLSQSTDVIQNFTSWRRCFDKDNVKKIIASARQAKAEGEFQCITLTSLTEASLALTISYGKGWFGTLSNNSAHSELLEQLQVLERELDRAHKKVPEQALVFAQQLTEMLVRTSLHGQSNFSDANTPTSPVYRQLIKMQDWCQQIITIAQFQSELKPLTLVDVDFHDTLHAAMFNVMAEANHQRNHIWVSNDSQLLNMVKLDVDLFQQSIVAMCRLMLSEQFNATLKLSLQVIDKNSGQQMVRFNGQVRTQKELEHLPELLVYLLTEDREGDAETPVFIRYVETLFSTLHANNLSADLNEQGFQFHLDLPLALAKQNHENIIDLKQINVLLLSGQKEIQEIVSDEIKNANGQIETLSKPEYFAKQLNVKHLNRKKVDVVILSADCFVTDFDNISQHIHSLPAGLQPKLLVLQSSYNAQLHQYGMYSQAETPLCGHSFLNQLQTLHMSDDKTNLVIEKDECKKQQCLPTQVELLFACQHPSKHQTMLRVLNWFGLQVRVVNSEQTMINHWASGRYLILFSEFTLSPFVEFSVGKTIQRGMFALNDFNFHELSEHEKNISANWKLGTVSDFSDLKGLAQLLSPWLKPKPSPVKNAVNASAKKSVALISDKQVDDTESDYVDLVRANEEELEHAFDLKRFADHQGSAEMAAFMLDEYTQDNQAKLNMLKDACAEHDIDKARIALAQLKINAQIMAAEKMLDACVQIEDILEEDITKLIKCLKPFEQVVTEVTEFADAI